MSGLDNKQAVVLLLTAGGCWHTDPADRGDRIEDVRERLRDPAAARDILDHDGFHPESRKSSSTPSEPVS